MQKVVKNQVQPQEIHYLENTSPLKLYRPVMMYLFEASTLVWLKLSQKPKPPSFFGVQTLPQLSHAILVFH